MAKRKIGVFLKYLGKAQYISKVQRRSGNVVTIPEKGTFLYLAGKWRKLVVDEEQSSFNPFTGEIKISYKFEEK